MLRALYFFLGCFFFYCSSKLGDFETVFPVTSCIGFYLLSSTGQR